MKAFQFIVILALFFGLVACEPMATFEASQPENAKSLKSFPKKLVGTYKSVGDRSDVVITRNLLIRSSNSTLTLHKNQLDSTVILKGDSLIIIETRQAMKVKFEGDSLVANYFPQDTLINLAKGDELKKFKGYFILNIKARDNQWIVKCLAYHKGMLSIKSMAKNTDLEKLQAITESPSDTVTTFNPSKKQFREFLKQNGFSAEKQFKKVKRKNLLSFQR